MATRGTHTARRLDWEMTPEAALSRWPTSVPLAALWSGDRAAEAGRWSRWTILARPTAHHEPKSVESLERLARKTRARRRLTASVPPFVGGWIGVCSYELGRVLEPAAGNGGRVKPEAGWPLLAWQRCPAALVHDGLTGQWWRVGDEHVSLPDLIALRTGPALRFRIGALTSATGAAAYQRQVERALEYIRAGDVFQVNIAHRLRAAFSGSTRALFAALMRSGRPRYGAYLRWPGRCVVSASPELFVHVDKAGRAVARPMKGTRPARGSEAELRSNTKDRAELDMIVDLMRNDLGRVARIGSVRVDEPRVIERHGAGARGVIQATATVCADLRAGTGIAGVLRAAFPGGSVTGAPKIRAMQIIEELEPVRRGPYCGAVGCISDCGDMALSIAIRTALIAGRDAAGTPDVLDDFSPGASLDWHIGAGIVADSEPRAEWYETGQKAGVILGVRQPLRRKHA